jgi:FkbM family methyltransferase
MIRKVLRNIPIFSDLFRQIRDALINFYPAKLSTDGFLYVGNKEVILGNYEPEIKGLLHKLSREFSTFINVGANRGYYLCLSTKLGFKNVIGVEPVKSNFRVAKRNLKLNKFDSVKVLNSACGDPVDGSVVLFGSGTGASAREGWGGAKSKIKQKVKVIGIDSLVNAESEPCIFLIDVEGYEGKVLDGSVQALARKSDIWLVEISFYENNPDGKMNPEALRVFRQFTSSGFSTYAWVPDLRQITIEDSKDLEEFAHIFHMFLFVKKVRSNDEILKWIDASQTYNHNG